MIINGIYLGIDECCKYCENSSVCEMGIDPDTVDDDEYIKCYIDDGVMVKAGKDALAIKMATGWERGADGKWRYEIEDLKLKKDVLGENEIEAIYGNNKYSPITRPLKEVVNLEFLPKT